LALFTVRPTRLDCAIADKIADRTNLPLEKAAEILTWGADEHVLIAAALGWWLLSRKASAPRRALSNHMLASVAVSVALPHVLKSLVDQKRPDRRERKRNSIIPKSGHRYDAFPSGHAVHVGTIASAATLLPPGPRHAVWTAGAVLSATRVALQAHWLSDVIAGLAMGVLIERTLRRSPGAPLNSRPPDASGERG
jgi:membrane-associated phospholipid phosphatase